MPVSAMSRVAIAIAAHGLPGLTGILSVPIEGTHSLSLTVVRAYSAAGGGWAVQQGRGHVLATWLAMAGPCCGGRALALRLDRGSGGASKPHPARDPGSGVRCVYRSPVILRVYTSLLVPVAGCGRFWAGLVALENNENSKGSFFELSGDPLRFGNSLGHFGRPMGSFGGLRRPSVREPRTVIMNGGCWE